MTDVQEMDELPWGAALIPEWWAELTPHHTIDIEEVDEERRRELARIAAIQAQLSGNSSHGGGGDQASVSDGSFLADTGVGGPYSLPGFKATDGINDASFVGPGNKRWFITSEGHFYDPMEPDVRYTAHQMAQSGYIPPGLEEEFTKGWDRSRSSMSPVDTSMYARTEEIQWQKPDWLKKKLRSTDQGAAIRHGLYSMEEKLETPKRRFNDDGSDVLSTSASPSTIPSASPSPIPTGSNSQQKKFADLFHNKTPQSTSMLTPTPTPTPTQSPYARRFGSPLKSETQNNNTQLTASSWHNNPTKKEVPQPERMLSWKPKKTRDTWIKQPKEEEEKEEEKEPEKEPTKPLWKKPQQSEDKQTAAAVISAPAPTAPVASVEIKKEEEEKVATSEIDQKEEEKQQTPAKPWSPPSPKKEQQQSIQTTLNLKPKAEMPTSLQSVAAPSAVTKETPEEKSVVVEPKTTKEEEKVIPAKVVEKEKPAASKDDNDGATSSSSSSAVSDDTSQELETLVSQGLVLKLMAMPDDASRAKELRDKVAPTPENKGEVMVKPNELLLAIAHHAQHWKNDAAQKPKIDRLRQIAIIARLVIMKLYGSDSPELKQFEDGLRPAFAT